MELDINRVSAQTRGSVMIPVPTEGFSSRDRACLIKCPIARLGLKYSDSTILVAVTSALPQSVRCYRNHA